MFVDASALAAILTDEGHARALSARLQRASRRITSPLAVFEATVAVARCLDLPVPDAREEVRAYLDLAGITVVTVPAGASDSMLDAHDRFGIGRHPAALSLAVSPGVV